MELNRLLRVVRSRWVIVALISATGFMVAFGLTTTANERLQPVFEGVVIIEFELEGEETVEDLAAEIESERRLAIFAAQDLMSEVPGSSIVADTNSARLVFAARGDTADEARGNVQQLVNAYQNADPSGGGNITERLDEYERQAVEIAEEMESLQPSLTDAEQELLREHELLDLQIARLQEEIVNLRVADAGANADVREENANRRAELAEDLEALQGQKSSLPAPPSENLSPTDQLRLDTLQRRMDILEIEYQNLALRTLGVTSGGNVEPPVVSDLTPEPANPMRNGMVGGLGGLGIALLALVVVTRGRKEVWLTSDVPMPVLGTVPRRRVSTLPGAPWYDSSDGGQRKAAIQALRTTIEGVLDQPSVAMALVGDRVEAQESHTLAVDVATAFANAGLNVLLFDADFSSSVEMTEFDVGEPSLETILRLPAGSSEGLRDRVSELLEKAIQIRPGLVVVPAGEAPASPADALAGKQFRVFVEEAKSRFDLVMVVAGSAASPTSQVVSQRIGSALVAVSPGKTTIPGSTALASNFRTQGVEIVGAVMVSGMDTSGVVSWPSRFSFLRPKRRSSASRQGEATDPAHDPVSRLRFYPTPMEKGSWTSQIGSLPDLVGDLTVAGVTHSSNSEVDGDDDEWRGSLSGNVLVALNQADRPDAHRAVTGYLVGRVEDIMTAVSGQANLSDELVSVVLQDGYLPLTRVPGHRTVGDWLIEELRLELGDEQGEAVAKEFARVLEGDPTNVAETLDLWVSFEFLPRHIERMKGAPEVWHLSSESGGFQALVYGRRLNQERLERLTTHLVRRAIDDLQRRLYEANQADDFDRVERIEADLRDLHTFEAALGVLRTGSSDDAELSSSWRNHSQQPRGWAPVWSEGIRPNIAPLQALGLLAHPVLTEEEMGSIRSAV